MASANTVKPDEPFWIKYTVRNQGGEGTTVIKLMIDKDSVLTKHCFIARNETRQDSVSIRLYAFGRRTLHLEGTSTLFIQVVKDNQPIEPSISNLQVSPIVKKGSLLHYQYTIKNKGGDKKTFIIPVYLNKAISHIDTIALSAGSAVTMYGNVPAHQDGLQVIMIAGKEAITKAYSLNTAALVLDIPGEVMRTKTVIDKSGFSNDGHRSDFGDYTELPHAASLDSNGTMLTMMEWVYDTGTNKPLTELLAKGDNHVLQLVDGSSLTFFAGGWGRGDCTVPLPADWRNHWHHIAGVCNGKDLRVYIDGELKGVTPLEEMINLNVAARWTIGSNEEFPLDRTFTGKIKGVKIYTTALFARDVMNIYTKEK